MTTADDSYDGALRGDVSVTDVADAWLAYQHGTRAEDDPNWWAVELWMESEWWEDEERVRAGILALVDAATTDLDYGVIGAAVIEVFIFDDEDRLRWIERHAAALQAFRSALANVYVWGEERNEVSRRIERAAGTRLPRPIGWVEPSSDAP